MDKLSIHEIKDIIERYFQIGDSANWKNRDYQNLSFQIQRKTKVVVSTNTLKRIFGKLKTKDSYTPQAATYQALQDYARSLAEESTLAPKLTALKYFKWIGLLVTVAILLSVLFVFFGKNNNIEVEDIDTNIVIEKIEGKNTASVMFRLEGNSHKHVDLGVHFGDRTDTIMLPKNRNNISHFYTYPGVFKPQLLKDKELIKTFENVVVPTDGWMAIGTSLNSSRKFKTHPISEEIIQKPGGYWHMTASDMAKCGMDTTKTYVLRFYNFQDFGIDGDSFQLMLRVKNAGFWPNVNCNNVIVFVHCRNGTIKQPFPKPGCSYWITARYSEVFKSGKKTDMSPFCVDLYDWSTIQINNANKEIAFNVNGEEIYTQTYSKSLGDIIGIQIQYFGTGYIDDFELVSADGSRVFRNDFGL